MSSAVLITRRERDARRARLVSLVDRLPEATATATSGRHLSLEIRGRRFGWLLDDHHGDNRLALNCRVPEGANRMLVSASPELFHIPKYLGHRGWVGAWLDIDEVDWTAVDAVLDDAYRLTAPRSLLRQLWEAG
jgi:hypothetical protein